MKRCFIMGHRDAPRALYSMLMEEIERHVQEYGVEEFLVGGYGGFDRMAAQALAEIKKLHPSVKLTLLIPYHPSEKPVALPKGFDESLYPESMYKAPRRLAIVRANQYAVGVCEYLIAYAWQPGSNTVKLVEYARSKERQGKIKICIIPQPMGQQALPSP